MAMANMEIHLKNREARENKTHGLQDFLRFLFNHTLAGFTTIVLNVNYRWLNALSQQITLDYCDTMRLKELFL